MEQRIESTEEKWKKVKNRGEQKEIGSHCSDRVNGITNRKHRRKMERKKKIWEQKEFGSHCSDRVKGREGTQRVI